MEWSEVRSLEFLELFQKEELIWNPKHRNHKNRQKINDAWNRISTSMGVSVSNLKLKKNSLMACFRTHLRKKRSTIKSGMGEEDVYEPIWFAFKFMEDFLAPVYDCGDTIDTEANASSPSNERQHVNEQQCVSDQTGNTEDHTIEIKNHSKETDTEEQTIKIIDRSKEMDHHSSSSPAPTSQRQRRRQLSSEINDAQKKIKQTFETLNYVISQKKQDVENDDCDLYGKLLANKLRNYSKYERHLIMHEIDGLLLRKPPCSISNISCNSYYTSSPGQDSTDSLPQSLVHINIPNQQYTTSSNIYLPSLYTPMPSQSPVQISIPNSPSSTATSYAPMPSQSPIHRPSSAASSYTPMPSQSPVQISIPNRPSSTATSYAPMPSQSPIHRPSSAASSYTPMPSQSPVQISIPNSPSSTATSYAPMPSQTPIHRPSSAASSYTPMPSQSPVQISIPNRPSSTATSYAPMPSQSPIHRPSSAASSYTPMPSQSPVQISIPNSPSSTATFYAPMPSQSPIHRPSSAASLYTPMLSQRPVQISIPNYQPKSSRVSTTQSNQIHILSEEVILPAINILQNALTNAEIDESDLDML